MEGRKKRVEKVAGPVERRGRRIDSARNTRFQLLGTDLVHNPRRGLLLLSSLGTRSIFEGSANVNLSTFSASLGIDVTNR